jgi:SAM-dependent methyltransferase
MTLPGNLQPVADFWNVEACGTQFVPAYADRRDFFAQFREHRYRTLWFIPELVPFESGRGKDVLEIGCGNGADGVMFASRGAVYTGVDLTPAAIDATREHFEILGLPGTFQTENAERLSFRDASFDIVYSNGVLHHTANPERAVAEVHRVLRPGGRAIVMLYHKSSVNYHLRIMCFMRARVLAYVLARRRRWDADRERLREARTDTIRGNLDQRVWEGHYKNFLARGWDYLRADRFVHHCTDGPECPIAYVYTRADAERLFGMFGRVETKVAHLPLRQYLGARLPRRLERALARRWGWALMIYAEK